MGQPRLSGEIFLCSVGHASCLTGCQSGPSISRLQDSGGKKCGVSGGPTQHALTDSARHMFTLKTSVDKQPY